MPFLPINKAEMIERGWDEPDIVLVTADAYIDHPSFGAAIISRVLERDGFRVCILSQPQTDDDYKEFGRPRLAFFIAGGNIDSMVAHYTVAKHRRDKDYYTAGGVMGKRPDRPTIAYTKAIRRVWGDIPVCAGGIEASLRRFAHYDYWDDRVRPSMIIDSGADLIIFGMGEHASSEIARRLDAGEHISMLTDIRGTVYAVPTKDYTYIPAEECPSYEEVSQNTSDGKRAYAVSCRIEQDESDAFRGKTVIQRHGDTMVIQNPPAFPLSTEELDEVYALPYMRTYHPSYEALGGVPAIEEVKFSITHTRGCFGACNFCSIAYHQGRHITCRSEESVINEAKLLTTLPDFKGYIHDVGGPTANFRRPSCDGQQKRGMCKGKKCLAPTPCKNLVVDQSEYLHLLRRLREIKGIKKVFIRSGIRFDYLLLDKNEDFFKDLVRYHVSGQLKVAPEHCSAGVLNAMGKPDISVYKRFQKRFYELTKSMNKKQYLVPYLMSSHPGSTMRDAVNLAVFLKEEGIHPEQVQDFYPTPGTVSTCMFYTGLDPYTMKPVYVPRERSEKAKQRALLQYFRPENKALIIEALKDAGRTDLIGYDEKCLVRPDKSAAAQSKGKRTSYGAAAKSSSRRTADGKNTRRAGGARPNAKNSNPRKKKEVKK
ncbi:MAG: YgiQ family radical SAM protein [Clostridiales bacterium]|nr:YgiQ family radical SAM protein [Clostridiales bacterium]